MLFLTLSHWVWSWRISPVEVALREQPGHVVPGRVAALLNLFVVAGDVSTAILRKWSSIMVSTSYMLNCVIFETHVKALSCCNSYFNVARLAMIVLPSATFSASVSADTALCTSSMAPVLDRSVSNWRLHGKCIVSHTYKNDRPSFSCRCVCERVLVRCH